MRKLVLAAGVLAVVACTGPARAAPTEQTFLVPTTGDLAQLCADTSGDAMQTAAVNFCHGYLLGSFQVMREINEARPKPAFCLTNPLPTRNEAVAQFVQWVQGDAGRAALPPADGVYSFLKTRFPCPATP